METSTLQEPKNLQSNFYDLSNLEKQHEEIQEKIKEHKIKNKKIKNENKNNSDNLPWTDKYRPKTLNDIYGNEQTVKKLKLFLEKKNIPNMILVGPPGVGKTSGVLCLAENLVGSDCKDSILELNASDERGIDVVRHKIKTFSQKKVQSDIKIIILDEADNMTSFAQQALRRTMEIYENTRFILTCNDINSIISPIQSRSNLFKLSRASNTDIEKKLIDICNIENIKYNNDGIELIVSISSGDFRQAINVLQIISDTFGKINLDTVSSLCNIPHPKKIKECVDLCKSNNLNMALNKITRICEQGFSLNEMINITIKTIKDDTSIKIDKKINIINQIIRYSVEMNDNYNNKTLVYGLFAVVYKNLFN